MALFALPNLPVRLGTRWSRLAPCSSRKAGFTVIELMLVVGIVAVLVVIALGSYAKYRERVQMMEVIVDIGSLTPLIAQYALDNTAYPDTLADIGRANMKDPWGTPYQYVSHDDKKTKGKWRKDHNIVPINSDFDLWSNGKDGQSSAPLTAKHSRDDVLRASNGRFIGLASDFDP